GFLSFTVFRANAFFNFGVDFCKLFGSERSLGDQFLFPAVQRIVLFALSPSFRAPIKFLIVGASVAGEPFHSYPPKMRSAAGPHFFNRCRGCIVNSLHVFSGELLPFVWLKNAERERIDFPRRTADAVSIVLDHKQSWQLSFFRETNRLEK